MQKLKQYNIGSNMIEVTSYKVGKAIKSKRDGFFHGNTRGIKRRATRVNKTTGAPSWISVFDGIFKIKNPSRYHLRNKNLKK